MIFDTVYLWLLLGVFFLQQFEATLILLAELAAVQATLLKIATRPNYKVSRAKWALLPIIFHGSKQAT